MRLKAGRAPAANKANVQVSPLLCGNVLSINFFVGKHCAHARVSARKRNSMVVKILRSEEKDLHDVFSGQSVHNDSSFDARRGILYRNVLVLSWIRATPDGNALAVPGFDEIQSASSSCLKKDSMTPSRRSNKRRKSVTMWTWSDAAKVSSDDMPVIGIKKWR